MKVKLNLNIFLFLVLFLLTNQLELYTLTMLFALLHELAHLICGLILGLKPTTFQIMPLGFSIEFQTKIEDFNCKILKSNIAVMKKLAIALAGPLFNLFVVLTGCFFHINSNIIYSNLLIFLFNLIPIYPLDGGRILKNSLRVFFNFQKARKITHIVSNIMIITFTMIASIVVYAYQNIAIVCIILVLWVMVIKENKRYRTYNKIYKVIDKSENYI